MAREYGAPEEIPKGQKVTGPERKDQEKKPKDSDPSPKPEVVRMFHRNADTDVRAEAIHHTLGSSPNQAAPGDHDHDGGTSKLLLTGFTLTGTKAGSPPTCIPSLIACLVRLGAKDSTT